MARVLDSEVTADVRQAARRNGTILSGKLLVATAAGLAMLLLVLPLAVLVVRGIETRGWQGLPGTDISEALGLSLLTSATAAAVIVLLGTPLAYAFARWRFPAKNLLNVLIQLPLVLPPAVAGLALLVTFGRRGFLGPALSTAGVTIPFSMAAVVIAQIFIAAPFFIRSAQVGFQSIEPEIEDAARVDGTSGLLLFWHITLPLARRALMAGLVLSWARALGEFGATIVFAGSLPGRTQTLPLLVYNVLERDIDASIWTGLILVAVALLAMLLSQWLTARETH